MTQTSTGSKFEIGKYECPIRATQATLELPAHMASIEWPVVVERCSACGQRHVLQYNDVRHPPALGCE